MANEYLVNSADLQDVANAIREKCGTSNALMFPNGFVDAVGSIQAGGGSDDGSFRGVLDGTATSPQLPSDLTSIRIYAFYKYQNLALTSLPSSLTSIGNYAFQNCSNLALTSLPSGLTSISNYAFQSCSKLALTSLPSGLTSIGNYAFQGCTNLKSLTFEGKPNSIFSTVFANCSNLATINVPWSEGEVANAPWGATNATINYNYTGEA